MKIGYVAEPYEEKNASGMGFVISELLKELLVQGAGHEFVVYSSKEVQQSFIPGDYSVARMPSGFLKKLWWLYRVPKGVDVMLFSAPYLPVVPPKGVRSLMICQELGSQKVRPGWREWPFVILRDHILMRLSLRRAEKVVAASHATETDLKKYYGVPQEKLAVIYDGYQDLHRYASEAPAVDQALAPYFLFVGKVKLRKNVHGIAQAFVRFKERTGASVKLVLAGDYGGEYYERVMRILVDGGVEQDVRFVGYVNGPQLYSYFKHALAVTFPSLNEGFGMPIIEAMSVGTPVITSSISSMAEAAGGAALVVDPRDPLSIAEAMERVYADQTLRQELVEKGYARARDFSWKKAGSEFLSLIEHA